MESSLPSVKELLQITQHRRYQGGQGRMVSHKVLGYLVILCFERQYSKRNTVARLKSNVLTPKFFAPQKVLAGYATVTQKNSFRGTWFGARRG